MDLWALQTSRPNPNPCPLPWVPDYKVIPPSLSCSNWICLRDLWKLTSTKAAVPSKKLLQIQQDTAEGVLSWFFFVSPHKKSTETAGDRGRAWDSYYPQVRPAWRASLGARWPRRQQAEPGLIKDVKPNWSSSICSPCTRVAEGNAPLRVNIRGVTLRRGHRF